MSKDTELFKCVECELSFRTNADIKRHIKMHDKPRPMFQSKKCPISLISEKALEMHVQM
jgi:uncharacterized C2H2 Zn-finger protein